jgi:hypothetical protein
MKVENFDWTMFTRLILDTSDRNTFVPFSLGCDIQEFNAIEMSLTTFIYANEIENIAFVA